MEQEGILCVTVGVDGRPGEAPAALWMQIADTGPGIPAEYFASIFEPFVTSKATGSGLGLAICQGIVEQHRGTIAAANRVDSPGAVFTIRFPIAQGEEVYEVVAPRCGDTHAALAMA
jgi:signal transduction histidine kinase